MLKRKEIPRFPLKKDKGSTRDLTVAIRKLEDNTVWSDKIETSNRKLSKQQL